jgi:hypothetical protein
MQHSGSPDDEEIDKASERGEHVSEHREVCRNRGRPAEAVIKYHEDEQCRQNRHTDCRERQKVTSYLSRIRMLYRQTRARFDVSPQ